MRTRVYFIVIFSLILVSVNGLGHIVLAYAPRQTSNINITITTRVLVVFAGIDNEILENLDLDKTYVFKLSNTSNSSLAVLVEPRILSDEIYDNITEFVDENSKHMRLAPFMREYLETYHPEWNISGGCYVRADLMEQYLYDIVEKTYNADNYDYVLFLFYYPRRNCLRTYYVERYFWEIHSTRNYTGLVAFGGNTPLFFIDLSSIPIPHPDKTQPLYGYGEPVNIHTFKPLWDISSSREKASTLKKYILDYLGFLVLRRLFDDRLRWTPRYRVDIHVIDYTDGSGYEKVLDVLNTSILYSYLRSLEPYTDWNIRIERVYANTSHPFMVLLENSTRSVEDNKTWIILDYLNTVLLISGHQQVVTARENETIIPVYVFVAGKPIRFEFKHQLNFTGAAVPGVAIIVSYPGYYYRVLEEGMGMVIAHEVGHMLGLTHPFEGYDPITGSGDMIWLYDYIASPMSYAPTLAGWLGGLFVYDAKSLCRYHVLDLVSKLLGKEGYEAVADEALKLLSKDKCLGEEGAMEVLLRAYLGANTVQDNNTVTVVETVTLRENHTVTKSLTTTITETITKTVTETVERTRTVTSTAIVTATIVEEESKTVTVTATITETPSWNTYILGALIALSVTTIALAVAVALRHSSRGLG